MSNPFRDDILKTLRDPEFLSALANAVRTLQRAAEYEADDEEPDEVAIESPRLLEVGETLTVKISLTKE